MEFDVLKANNRIAHENYHLLKEHNIKSVDFMGSIGAGKTALIIEMGKKLVAAGKRVCVIAGDVTGDDDFQRFRAAGLDAVNCNTGKECHLDANLIKKTLATMDLDKYDIVIVENVGNLVCPADFPLGTDYRAVVVSTTEGDDMVRKHHAVFQHSDIAILNKMDICEKSRAQIMDELRARLGDGAVDMTETGGKLPPETLESVAVCGEWDSYAQQYAYAHELPFVYLPTPEF